MALVAWGTFFTDMSNHVEECADMSYCEAKYEGFLKDLGVWLDPGANTEDKAFAHIQKEKLKRVDWGEVAVIAGITVVSTGICILCPPATPWVIAGGVAAGALAEGGMEVYEESKTGEYDWVKILTKTLGGGLKGALAASPLKPLATGVGVATTGAIEDYIYCIANGETHEQTLKSAAINGTLEGVTAGGCKWLCNAVANRVKVKKLPETNPKPISGELPEGTKGPLKINIQLFAREGQEIVGTEFSEIKPTQLEINPERVQYYIDKIKSGQKLDPVPIVNVEGKGRFLLEGHHRYVASKMMGVEIDLIEIQGNGPIGLKNWSQVEWTGWNGFEWIYK